MFLTYLDIATQPNCVSSPVARHLHHPQPGRFDRRVAVGLPDVKGREQILEVHIRFLAKDGLIVVKHGASHRWTLACLLSPQKGVWFPGCRNSGGNKKLEENITLTEIAQRTAGFSGADLENLMNELLALSGRASAQTSF